MSVNFDEAGPSRSKRKSSDPDAGNEDCKFKAENLSCIDDVTDESSDDDKAAQLGEYLSAQYEVLLRVLSNLSAFDLRRAALVSKAWQSAARVVRDSRQQLHWLFWNAKPGMNIDPPLVLQSSIREMYSQPTLCVAFFTKNARKSFECSTPKIICPASKDQSCCGKLHPMESFMATTLGPKCDILSLTVSGTVGTSDDLKFTHEVEFISKSKVQSMSAALFPNFPGVKIERFKLTKQELLKGVREHISCELDMASRLGLPGNMLIQAVVIFTGSRIRGDEVSMLVACLQSRQDHRIPVAGGIDEKPDNVEGLVFLGDNVCAASLVIPETVTERDTAVQYISRLKSCNLPSERALCFMFTCLGRGTIWYEGRENVESEIINEVFPRSPVIGFFGQGEIGINVLPGFEAGNASTFWANFKALCNEGKTALQAPPKVVKRGELSIDHSYSTCLLYLSFNTAKSSLPI